MLSYFFFVYPKIIIVEKRSYLQYHEEKNANSEENKVPRSASQGFTMKSSCSPFMLLTKQKLYKWMNNHQKAEAIQFKSKSKHARKDFIRVAESLKFLMYSWTAVIFTVHFTTWSMIHHIKQLVRVETSPIKSHGLLNSSITSHFSQHVSASFETTDRIANQPVDCWAIIG